MGAMKEMAGQTAQAKIYSGFQDGISVIPDPENARYVIEAPNDYDVNFVFRGKNKDGSKFAEELQTNDKKKTMFAVGLDSLSSEENIKNFNFKVRDARTAFARKQREIQSIADHKELLLSQMSIDKGVTNPTVVLKWGVPTTTLKDENEQPILQDGKTIKVPDRIGGEVLGYIKGQDGKLTNEQGTYFVLFGDIKGQDNIRYLRAIPTNNLLQAGEFAKRDEVITEKFPVGSRRYVEFDEKWKAKKIKEYKPQSKENKELAQEEFAKAEERLKQLSDQAKVPENKTEQAIEKISTKAPKTATKSKSKTASKDKEFDDIPF
ncbi:hypothetical protein F7R25_03805 [Burkholderia stagnalis]|uniref:Uncharacterized protein n=1 Tax=Burkholderia stagnalis TaxID=1503054 RepID=A0A6L3N3P5_9BURK|nr:hypothetical protein [Burkholderia stagnalis]KAB0640629.1 hypothetical protein F7R25_03805 [Burkholderia stagnalis]VWB05713.1 hypothetical protein BST28156_00079 [Burkholderia stagnalis]